MVVDLAKTLRMKKKLAKCKRVAVWKKVKVIMQPLHDGQIYTVLTQHQSTEIRGPGMHKAARKFTKEVRDHVDISRGVVHAFCHKPALRLSYSPYVNFAALKLWLSSKDFVAVGRSHDICGRKFKIEKADWNRFAKKAMLPKQT